MGRQGPWPGGYFRGRAERDPASEHLYLTPYPEDDVLPLVELMGADHVLFGSDYPHPEGPGRAERLRSTARRPRGAERPAHHGRQHAASCWASPHDGSGRPADRLAGRRRASTRSSACPAGRRCRCTEPLARPASGTCSCATSARRPAPPTPTRGCAVHVGVCDATVGPGVTNLVSGLAEAYARRFRCWPSWPTSARIRGICGGAASRPRPPSRARSWRRSPNGWPGSSGPRVRRRLAPRAARRHHRPSGAGGAGDPRGRLHRGAARRKPLIAGHDARSRASGRRPRRAVMCERVNCAAGRRRAAVDPGRRRGDRERRLRRVAGLRRGDRDPRRHDHHGQGRDRRAPSAVARRRRHVRVRAGQCGADRGRCGARRRQQAGSAVDHRVPDAAA